MSRSNLPWYKRCPSDWRNGTRSCGMSMELRGFYSECLDAMWELQACLPVDHKRLAMLLGCNPRTVSKLMPRLIDLGKMLLGPGGYYNPRMLSDIMGVGEAELAEAMVLAATGNVLALGVGFGIKFASASSSIPAELEPKVGKKQANTTREEESESESDSPIRARGVISIDRGRVVVPADVADDLRTELPGTDVAAVADMAAPEILRFRAPSQADMLAVLRKWARIGNANVARRSFTAAPSRHPEPASEGPLGAFLRARATEPTATSATVGA